MFKNRENMIYLITDSRGISDEDFYEKIEIACREGIDILQLREKEASTMELLEKGRRIKEITDRYNVLFIIDDRVDIALALDCDGVHVGTEDMPVALARKILGPNKIVGATAKTVKDGKKAEEDGANYLGVGAIYHTTTHAKPKRTSIETLKEIVENVDIGVFAIGGLTANNVDILKGSGINGVCIVRYLMQSDEIEKDLQRLKDSLSK